MIRAFLFDIGNVLLKFDFSLALKAVAGWVSKARCYHETKESKLH